MASSTLSQLDWNSQTVFRSLRRTNKQPHLRAVTEHLGFMEKASSSPVLSALRSTFSTFQHLSAPFSIQPRIPRVS
ncbi:hypothetical protein CEP51_015091 [Fusarium floridanum]|uniref:Uncharacterized protein n=1 Tax=Fusarium floridanum TaxID=1325733 RepID=A0A428PGR5_9HYPO|nr:hypothetical protein CEP51_015091 [Fusarium floridanum]